VIVTEMLASLGGLGYVISYHRSLFDTGHVYFGMALALLIALGVNIALTRLDRRIGHWRLQQQGES
jgi:ABC-type nitrate/sulfonate/bicarbonate transport system permease component